MINHGWSDILDADKSLVWQGKPDGAIVWKSHDVVALIFGIFFSGFALFWMIAASKAGGGFWIFGLLHFTVGLGIAFGPVFYSAWKRRHSWYTLTNKRAIIARNIPLQNRSIKTWPILPETVLTFERGPKGSVFFATEQHRRKNDYITIDIGFERLDDAAAVFCLMRDIQIGEPS